MTCLCFTNARAERRRNRMRILAATMLLVSTAAPALAADWPQEPPPVIVTPSSGPVRWDGFHFGGTMGLSNMNTDFGNSSSSLIAYSLRNTTVQNEFQPSSWTTLPSNTTSAKQYGLFMGYNMQWSELVLGFDVAYNRPSSLQASASDTIARQVTTSSNVNEALTITAASSISLVDYMTLRTRAGYAMGQFLPYAVIGAAVGRFNYSTTATVHDVGTPLAGSTVTAFNTFDTQSSSKNNAIVGGFVVGLGLDVAILPNVFLRAEWETTIFAPVSGIRTNLNTGRVGVGLRF